LSRASAKQGKIAAEVEPFKSSVGDFANKDLTLTQGGHRFRPTFGRHKNLAHGRPTEEACGVRHDSRCVMVQRTLAQTSTARRPDA
jgi:hypothetical protein